jgi:hypothetical protein
MTHITQGHKCICGNYGHGQLECGNEALINNLMNTVNATKLELPKNLHCNIVGCATRHTHTRESHICGKCSQRENCLPNCENIYYTINCPSCRKNNKISQNQKLVVGLNIDCIVCAENKANVFFPECGHMNVCIECVNKICSLKKSFGDDSYDNNFVSPLPIIGEIGHDPQCLFNIGFSGVDNYEEQIEKAKQIFATKTGKIFFCSYAGMGCHLFVKRNDINSDIEIFFMHSDSWGQYGQSDVPELNAFINGYELLKNTYV